MILRVSVLRPQPSIRPTGPAPMTRPASQEVDVILLAKHLERVADHATNIAEDVIPVAEARNVKHAAKLAR